VPLIYGHYASRPVSVCQNDNGKIGKPDIEVGILAIVLAHHVVIASFRTSNPESNFCEILQERGPRLPT